MLEQDDNNNDADEATTMKRTTTAHEIMDELNSLIHNPLPGLDELVALANVLDPKYAEEYDMIVVDMAPTGHTLRILQLPQFRGIPNDVTEAATKVEGAGKHIADAPGAA